MATWDVRSDAGIHSCWRWVGGEGAPQNVVAAIDDDAPEACMIGTLLNEALHETVHTVGVPEAAAKAMLFGHVQIALTNALRGSNPFSEACEIAIQYGKDTIIKDDWKKIFNDSELDNVIAKMLKLEAVKR